MVYTPLHEQCTAECHVRVATEEEQQYLLILLTGSEAVLNNNYAFSNAAVK
jgi:hypothetical protein